MTPPLPCLSLVTCHLSPEYMINTAHKLYLEHAGRDHRLVEREMHRLGFTSFSRRRFYNSRTRSGRLRLGWIEKFRWKESLRSESAEQEEPSDPRSVFRDPQFEGWLPQVSPSLHWEWPYQKLIYEKLRAITDGASKRLMIFLPPRHGKSELVTVRYTAWRLHRDPSLNVILGSYNQHLANRFSRKVRVTWEDSLAMQNSGFRMQDPSAPQRDVRNGSAFPESGPKIDQKPLPSTSSRSNNSHFTSITSQLPSSRRRLNTVAEWETGLGGGVRAVGAGGGITGFGAGLVIIDDPVKSRAEAESRTYREKIWEWFRDDLYTRLEPGAAIILIQTRWHEDDLAGRLLKEMQDGGEHWDVVSLPALAESGNAGGPPAMSTADEQPSDPHSAHSDPRSSDPLGREPREPLCPDRFTREDLLRIKRRLGTYSFSALYQQRPTPAEGGLFKRTWFSRVVEHAPENLRWCRG